MIGTSVVRSPMRTDLSTISEAYSQDCDCEPHAHQGVAA